MKPTPPDNREIGGALYVVATPIGHPDDITLRALKVLGSADLVAAEDTRETGRLLAHHGIEARLVSCHEFNESTRAASLVRQMVEGAVVALVSDAGTPSVSDPGYRLITAGIDAGVRVIPVPGPSAAIAALSVSGLPTDSFVFVGFIDKKPAKRRRTIESLAAEPRTLVFYESPRRIVTLLADLRKTLGDRPAVLGREMTKPHEELIRGPLSEIEGSLRARAAVKGECTLLMAGAEDRPAASPDRIESALTEALAEDGATVSDVARRVSRELGIPRKQVYAAALRMKADSEGG